MAVDLTEIRKGLVEFLKLSLPKTPVFAHDVATPVYPRIIVLPGEPYVTYHSTFGPSLTQVNLLVEVKATAADPESAQIQLARFLGTGTGQTLSIADAIEKVVTGQTTPTLGGLVENVTVDTVSVNTGEQLTDNTIEFAATFRVAALVRRT